jgi:hypothetical protein
MEEQVKPKMNQKEAKNYIIQKLRNRKIICAITDKFREDISSENFLLEIISAGYHGFMDRYEDRNYSKINIKIVTISYPHVRRAVKDFDLKTGDYSLLAEKVNFIIKADIKMKDLEKEKELKQSNFQKILKEKLEVLGAIKGHYGDMYKIKTKYFEMKFWAFDTGIRVNIEEPSDMTIDQAIELIKKLQ